VSKPFARAIAMFALISAAMGDSLKLAAIGPYKSRGHGRGKPGRSYGNKSGRYMPHQGKQETYRRKMGGWARMWREATMTKASAFHGDMHGVYHGR
jgi:hypothetical protein